MIHWIKTTGKFVNNDSDDELLQEICDDVLYIDLGQVVAIFPSKYDGFIKLETRSGQSFCIKETMVSVIGIINELVTIDGDIKRRLMR